MPIHDWTRVRANRFHDFHQSWTVAICNALNTGRLPTGYFAMIEKKAGGPQPDLIFLDLPVPPGPPGESVAADVHPPRASIVTSTDAARYARKANHITIRHPDGDVAAVVEVVSPGNKNNRHALHTFARKAAALLNGGIHLLIVDLFPPGCRDPQGIHKVIWDRFQDEPFTLPPDKPLTLAAYAVATETVAYIEPVAVGGVLPDMPIFLTAGQYVPCPLEETYMTAWEQFPTPLKGPLESSSMP